MSQIKLGNTDIPFVFRGDELMYPNYVKDGLVLHYDFSGMTNADTSRGIAKDLSGNGNHGTLQNFNFTPESGYDKNKLLFDGVDDRVESIPMSIFTDTLTLTTTLDIRDVSVSNVGYAMTLTDSGATRFWLSKNGAAIRCQMYDGGEIRSVSTGISTGKQSVTVTFDGKLIRMYKNGLPVSEFVSETPFTSWTSNNLYIGSYDNGGAYAPPKINQKNFMMYNRPLTPEEIAHNYAIEKERFNIQEV